MAKSTTSRAARAVLTRKGTSIRSQGPTRRRASRSRTSIRSQGPTPVRPERMKPTPGPEPMRPTPSGLTSSRASKRKRRRTAGGATRVRGPKIRSMG